MSKAHLCIPDGRTKLYLADAQKFADAVALVGLEKAVDAHLFKVSLAEVSGGVARVELRISPHVTNSLL